MAVLSYLSADPMDTMIQRTRPLQLAVLTADISYISMGPRDARIQRTWPFQLKALSALFG
eukprot:10004078-Alexandrium_andersonii.AAC.1